MNVVSHAHAHAYVQNFVLYVLFEFNWDIPFLPSDLQLGHIGQ